MNFQDLALIETADTYLDNAFKKGRRRVEQNKVKKFKQTILKKKHLESIRVGAVGGYLTSTFNKIVEVYPSIDHSSVFYRELMYATLDVPKLKKSLAATQWVSKKVNRMTGKYQSEISREKEYTQVTALRNGYYGRVSSMVKQIRKELLYLEEARKVLRKYPAVKSDIYTVCICGFPNIGKTTLLSKMTDADPEISNYSFTTKGINIGYIRDKDNRRVIQVMDTPGTLNRPEKMNAIEKQAYIAMKEAAHLLVYVFDLTEPYPMADQKELYEVIQSFGKPTMVYLSKTDVLDKKVVESFDLKAIKSDKELTSLFLKELKAWEAAQPKEVVEEPEEDE